MIYILVLSLLLAEGNYRDINVWTFDTAKDCTKAMEIFPNMPIRGYRVRCFDQDGAVLREGGEEKKGL